MPKTKREHQTRDRAIQKALIGRRIVKAEPNGGWEEGEVGGYREWMHSWELTLDDGVGVVFTTEEHPIGAEYGTNIILRAASNSAKPAPEWPQVGDEVDVDDGPKFGPSTTRGILVRLTVHPDGAQAYVVALRDGKPSSRIGCPVGSLTKTGRVASPEEIKAIQEEDDLDDCDIGRLTAECARLREYADVLDVLRKQHPDAVRTLRAWDTERRGEPKPRLPSQARTEPESKRSFFDQWSEVIATMGRR